jgi:integrase
VAGRIIRPALERAGVPWKGYHACRRGLGTTLRGLTGNSNAGRDMLGHSDERVTQDHYEDRMPEELLKGMKMLES